MSTGESIDAAAESDLRWAAEPYPDYAAEVNKSIAFSGVEHSFFTQGKAKRMLEALRRRGETPAASSLIDIGCGVGLIHRFIASEFREVLGVDVARDALETAKRNNPSVSYREYDGRCLLVEPGSFDVAATICVMHHVPPDQQPGFIAQAWRAVRRGGWFLVFEHNPWNPLTRLAVARCPFDFDAVLISAPRLARMLREGGFVDVAYEFLFFTPFSRRLIERAENQIRWLPAGAQYLAMGRRPF
jgi:SAM-dependent methyltransferase